VEYGAHAMSRHWKPSPEKIVRIRPAGGWARIRGYWRAHRSMPKGAKAGLLLIAAACVGIAIGAYHVLGPRDVVADEVANR
jgi:hypothetical protein